MRRMQQILSVALTAVWAAGPVGAAEAPVTAFVDVNVVPMDRERVLLRQTVVVRGEQIEAMGAVATTGIPPGARRIEGNGRSWLLPGLADMHTHLGTGEDAALYVAGGVTTVLQMGGDGKIDPIPRLRALLRDAVAPQIFFAFMIDGPAPESGGWPVDSDEAARFAVRVARERQYDFIKIYHGISPSQFEAIVEEARKHGLAVIGHGVRSVGVPEGLLRGQVMVAHAEEFYYTTFRYRPDDSRIAEVATAVRRSGAYVTPNLSFIDAIIQQWGKPAVRERFLRDPLVGAMSVYARTGWMQPRRNYANQPEPFPMPLSFLQRFTAELAEQGVPLLAGTDSPLVPGLVPGVGLNEELRLLVDSGLSRFDALSTATRVPGEFIVRYVPGAARFGVVEVGTRGDLLLVADNPLDHLDTLRKPLGVMTSGQWRSAEEIGAVIDQNRRMLSEQTSEMFGGDKSR